MKPPDGFPIGWVHAEGCKGIGFWMRALPKGGSIMDSSDARNPDGTQIAYGSPVRCGACGELLRGTPRRTFVKLEDEHWKAITTEPDSPKDNLQPP